MMRLRVLLAALACLALALVVAGETQGDCGTYKNGQTWTTGPPETCAQYTCKNGSIKGKLCSPVYAHSSKCKVKEVAKGAVYPDCCRTIECP